MSTSKPEVQFCVEPACWGSNELPLIPPRLSTVIANHSFTLRKIGTKKSTRYFLSDFATPNWGRRLRGHVAENENELLGVTLLREIKEACTVFEDKTDLPILAELIYGWPGIDSIPLRTSTIKDLQQAGLWNADGIATCMSGSFLEAFQLLESWESVIDLAVTSEGWINPLIGVPKRFVLPSKAQSLAELQNLLQIRYARTSGVARIPSAKEVELWEAIGGRLAIDFEGQWTLALCGDHAGMTRERFRQIMGQVIWDPWPRQWPFEDHLESALNAIAGTSIHSIVDFEDSQGNQYHQIDSEQVRYLASLAGVQNDPRTIPHTSPAEALLEAGFSLRELHDVAFHVSERMGFVQHTDLRLRMAQVLGEKGGHLLDEATDLVCRFRHLPHGYSYLDGNRTSFTFNILQSLLSLLGPLKVPEAHAACVRNSVYRAGADFPFPPLSVFRAWLDLDDRFEIVGERVMIAEPIQVDLGKIQGWMKDAIESSPGRVIHRTMLYELGRRDGVRPGTLNVYCSFNPYFRPAGSNCVTLTGVEPSQEDIQQARLIAAEFKVKNQLLAYNVENGVLRIRAIAGTEMCDSGLFSMPVIVRRLLGNSRYRAIFNGNQHGHISQSGGIIIGFASVLAAMNVVPGDQVEISFDLAELTATFDYLKLVNVDSGPKQ